MSLAVVGSSVLLVAKRAREGHSVQLLIYQFDWDDVNAEFTHNDRSPHVVTDPSSTYVRTGDEVWIGHHPASHSVLVLTQCASFSGTTTGDVTHSLVAFQADAASLDVWSANEIAEGGFDFDAVLEGDGLHVVYRPTRWPFSRSITVDDAVDATGQRSYEVDEDPAGYGELAYQINAVPTYDVWVRREAIPGGEHPRIQCIDPLYVTVNRFSQGRVEIDYAAHNVSTSGPPSTPEDIRVDTTLRPSIQRTNCHLLYFDSARETWYEGLLRSFPLQRLPRFIDFEPREPIMLRATLAQAQLTLGPASNQVSYNAQLVLSARHEFHPVWMTPDGPRETEVAGEKANFITFLYRIPESGTLSLCSFLVFTKDGRLIIRAHEEAHVDINHELVLRTLHPDGSPENSQFQRFFTQTVSSVANAHVNVAQPSYGIDNRIGTSVVIDRNENILSCFAYSDGDGGLRMVFDDNGINVDMRSVDESKYFNGRAVSGVGSNDEKWVTIPYSGAWEQGGLATGIWADWPTTPNELEVVMGVIQSTADSNAFSDPVSRTELAFETWVADDIEESMVVLALGQDASNQGQTLTARWTMPGVVFANRSVTLNASSSSEADPAHSIQTFRWQISRWDPDTTNWEAEADLTGPVVDHLFTIPGDYSVQMTVTSSNPDIMENERTAVLGFEVLSPLLDTVWESHKLANENAEPIYVPFTDDSTLLSYELGNMDISVSRYNFRFRLAPDGSRDRAEITFNDDRNERWRFEGSESGQGRVDFCFELEFYSDDIKTGGPLGHIIDVDKFHTRFRYGRPFSPGVFMSDQKNRNPFRPQDPPIETVEDAASLGAKPVGEAWIDVQSVDIELSPKGIWGWAAIDAVLALLTALSLWGLAAVIETARAGAFVGIAIPGGSVAAFFAFVALVEFIRWVVFEIIEEIVARRVKKRFENEDSLRDGLDSSRVLTYAGDAVAELIATRALERRNAVMDPDIADDTLTRPGQIRHIPQIWQQVFISDGECRVLVR